ncbi:hypothetical protein QAD02_023384 [Eretmocerus hayati]|uniref:Uncharacterized protein n=1 Tax=Eretmocerus hayati TaxID=131215 RepID=A0ACC2PVZ4_9HYME|nr:hypothetical protein QAD02_023384 [Eretmocerus hayati]
MADRKAKEASIMATTHSVPLSKSYVAAVVEYSPVTSNENGVDIHVSNAENYVKFIEKASQYSADIIIFPESSLSTGYSGDSKTKEKNAASFIPDPIDEISPCRDENHVYKYTLKRISCAAEKFKIYIAVNHLERVDCEGQDCPTNGFLMYNTNVVFDRTGVVIAKYRKYNLFGEPDTNKTSEPMLSTFRTDFGVTFGQFICFDLMFREPALNLTRDLGITDIIFSSHWFSELPFLHSLEAQAAWAYGNDINFLASGYNEPTTGSGGSGIYAGRKGYIHVVGETKRSNTLVVAKVPKVINGTRICNISLENLIIYNFNQSEISTTEITDSGNYRHLTDNLTSFKTESINSNMRSYDDVICSGEFCCHFALTIDFDETVINGNTKYYRYRMAVFDGVRSFSGYATGHVSVCGIISCINDTLEGCGQIFKLNDTIVKPMTFQSLQISIRTHDSVNYFFMPTTLTHNIIPLNVSSFSFTSSSFKEISDYDLHLIKATDDLLTFSIYGRDFKGKERA